MSNSIYPLQCGVLPVAWQEDGVMVITIQPGSKSLSQGSKVSLIMRYAEPCNTFAADGGLDCGNDATGQTK